MIERSDIHKSSIFNSGLPGVVTFLSKVRHEKIYLD